MSFQITIEGVDKTSKIVFNSLDKTDNLNQQVDNCDFTIRKYGTETYVPSLGDEVIITKGSTTIFGGVIVRITEEVIASKILEYRIECNDYSQFLKRQVVTERYENMSAHDIIEDIVNNYTTDGFTIDNVVADIIIDSVSFNRLSVADCFQKLADAISYVWYVDYDMDIHFFSKNTEIAPFNLSDSSNNYIFNSLQIVEDISQLRNSVLVQGGDTESTTTRTELFNGDASRVQFALANKFSEAPVVLVGGTTKTVGVEFLDDDGSFQAMFNFNEKYIRFTAGNTPGSGTNNVTVTAKYIFPIVVRVPDPSSIAEFGLYEYTITDKTIKSQDEAIARAIAELQAYREQLYEGTFRTYEDGLRSGQVININSTQRDKNIDVLIQSVRATMRDPNGDRLEYEVRFATLKSIGIIEFLQNQLRSKEVIVDDEETLLNLISLNDTAVSSADSIAHSTSSPPYKYSNNAGTTTNKGRYEFSTYS